MMQISKTTHRRRGIRPSRDSARVSRWVICIAVWVSAQGCAAHRQKLPECKGPLTPINQSLVTVDGAQR